MLKEISNEAAETLTFIAWTDDVKAMKLRDVKKHWQG